MTRLAHARINLSALQHNLGVARHQAPTSKLVAVIKADAYGHGSVAVAHALDSADAFAVARLDEAVKLRDGGIRQPILLLEGVAREQDLALALHHQLMLVIHTPEQVQWLERAASKVLPWLWLKVDTGMHRLGIRPNQTSAIYDRLARLNSAKQIIVMSHLACADQPERVETSNQLARFQRLVSTNFNAASLANSAAILSRPDTHFDWIRPGIMLYGVSPLVGNGGLATNLRPGMTLTSELIATKHCQAGDTIGYGGGYHCTQDTRIGVIAIGYGDGYPRQLPSGTPVLVNGKRCALVGRVSMDMITVDLSAQPQAQLGDTAILWGEGLPIETIAAHANTIAYELLCQVSQRVPREYLE